MKWIKKKKRKLPRYPNFSFYPIPKIENLEISKSFLLLQILTVVVTFPKFVFSRKREREREREREKERERERKTLFFCDF